MAKQLKGKAVIAQGGGPTAVINESLVGAVLEARKYPQIEAVYGARHGVRGIVDEDFLDLSRVPAGHLEAVAKTPSSALLSTREKPDEEYCRKILDVLKAQDVRYFFYNGGNDSADTCRIIGEAAEKSGYALCAVHIPKTIDNDLRVSDHCPGFGSAAKFVASAFAGAGLDNRAIPGVYIGVVMGRHAGFLTAAGALARRNPDDAPHLVYIPECPFSEEKFLADVERVFKKHGRCVAAVSEGVCDASGAPIITSLTKSQERDAHGNVQLSGTGALGDALSSLVKEKLKIKRVRSDTFGYLQRSYLGTVSEADAAEARAVGVKAVEFAAGDGEDGSVAIRRVKEYAVEYFRTPLATVAKHTKHMPEEFYDAKAALPTRAFLDYARPLIGELTAFALLKAPPAGKALKAG